MLRMGSALPGRMSAWGPDMTVSPTFTPEGGDDVALLAVAIEEQGEAGRAIRIVLDGRHPRGNAELLAAEVHLAQLPLVAAARGGGR